MLLSGACTMGVRHYFGENIDRVILNYFGHKRGNIVTIIFYVGMFFSLEYHLSRLEKIDMNHLVNLREFNGEVVTSMAMKAFPNKINHARYQAVMQEK